MILTPEYVDLVLKMITDYKLIEAVLFIGFEPTVFVKMTIVVVQINCFK